MYAANLPFQKPETIIYTESQVLNSSNLGPWYGSVFLENVTCNGTERFGFQCNTPGPGVVTSPECYYPNRTAGVRCFRSELEWIELVALFPGLAQLSIAISSEKWETACYLFPRE